MTLDIQDLYKRVNDGAEEIASSKESIDAETQRLNARYQQLFTQAKELQNYIKNGETTGDDILDYHICRASPSPSFLASVEQQAGKARATIESLDEETPYLAGYIWEPSRWRTPYVFTIQEPRLIADKGVLAVNARGIKIVCNHNRTLEHYTFTMEPITQVSYHELEHHVPTVGWDAITSALRGYSKQGNELVVAVLEHFKQPIDAELIQSAHQLQDTRILHVLKTLDVQYHKCSAVWSELERMRKEREDLQRKQASQRRAPVLSISDQLDRDRVDMALDAFTFRPRPNHDAALHELVRLVRFALDLEVHEHPRDLHDTHRPGKVTVWNPKAYMASICSELELLSRPAKSK